MSQQPLQLYIDVQNRQLVRGANTSIPSTLPDVYQGDTLSLSLNFLDATGNTVNPYSYVDYSAAAVTVAVGSIALPPNAGYFTITDTVASETTGNIAFNSTASAVQSAIQAALTTHWSTATVAGSAGGPYTITNGSTGAQADLMGTSVSLTPVASVIMDNIQTGTSGLPSIQGLRLAQNPVALQDTWTPIDAPSATVTELQAGSGTQDEIQQVLLSGNPYAGAFVINFNGASSNPIQWNATPAGLQSALQATSTIGTGNVSVGGTSGAWVVTFTGALALASQPLMTVVSSGLVGPVALIGTLALNTSGIEEAIGEQGSITQVFAIRVTPAGESPFTVIQESITINNDLIVGAPSAPAPGASYLTLGESDARYFQIADNLSESTVATVRTNLGLDTRYLQKSNNLSDVTGSTARTNLGLAIGTNVQAWNTNLDTLAASSPFTAGTNITITGTYPALTFAATGGGSTAWQYIDSNHTAVAGDKLWIDGFSGSFTITLPASPANLDIVTIADFWGNFTGSGLGFASNPQTVSSSDGISVGVGESFGSPGTTYTLNRDYQTVTFIYSSAYTSWLVNDPVSQIPPPPVTSTFTLSSGAATVSHPAITANSVITVTLKTASGTRAGNPDIVPTAGTGFVATGGGSDNSTYNYTVVN
jgi:hypothetical protein